MKRTIFLLIIFVAIVFFVHQNNSENIGAELPIVETQAVSLQKEPVSFLQTAEITKLNSVVSEFGSKQKFVQVKNGVVVNAGEKITTKLPSNMSIDVVDGPEGKGYSVKTVYHDKIISVGYGAYANDNTWVQVIEQPTASST